MLSHTTTHLKVTRPWTLVGPPWLSIYMTRAKIDRLWLIFFGVMTFFGGCFFGWRAVLQVTLTASVSVAVYLMIALIIHLFNRQYVLESFSHIVGMSWLTGLLMPVMVTLQLPVLAGLLVGISMHLVGRTRTLRIHPVALAIALTWLAPMALTSSPTSSLTSLSSQQLGQSVSRIGQSVSAVLTPCHLFLGQLENAKKEDRHDTWWTYQATQNEALRRQNPFEVIQKNQRQVLLNPPQLTTLMVQGQLPRLAEIYLGVVPAMIGASSVGLLIMLGLIAMYRRLSWWPMPLVSLAAMLLTLMFLPITTPKGTTLVINCFWTLSPAYVTSYLSYMVLASPFLLITLLLAPSVAPMTFIGRLVFGFLLGMLCMVMQWFFLQPQIMFFALVFVGIFSKSLDCLHLRPRCVAK